jgi:glutamate synthase domain-containing protein 3
MEKSRAICGTWVKQRSGLRSFIENHAKYTGSQRARDILDHWSEYRVKFVKVFPKEYRARASWKGRKLAA